MGPAVPCSLVQFQNFMAKAECNAVPRNLSRDRSSMWQDVYGVPHVSTVSYYLTSTLVLTFEADHVTATTICTRRYTHPEDPVLFSYHV